MKKSNKVILIAVLIIIIATLTSCIGIYFVNKNKDTDPNSIPNIDKLESPKEDYVRVLACGVDKSQKLTDVIMYAVYDVKNQSINVLQIPRDSFIGTDYVSGKINSVYGSKKEPKDSMKELEKILEEQFKLQVDYTASITLEGVSNIVDSLGGVKMNVPMTLNYLPGKVIYEGEQIIDGEKAEWLVRFRSGYKNADIGRLNMQKEFLMAMLDTVKDKGRIAAVSDLAANF
ncbi:MAG: LCP family protein, partial [Oscillospiraceae bacterium]